LIFNLQVGAIGACDDDFAAAFNRFFSSKRLSRLLHVLLLFLPA
jgi:hypothetical protein